MKTKNIKIGIGIHVIMFIVVCLINPSFVSAAGNLTVNKHEKIDCGKQSKNKDPLVCYYLQLIQIITSHWDGNHKINMLDEKLKTLIVIEILKNGKVKNLTIEAKSGNSLLDDSAINAIVQCIPFPELPEGMESVDIGLAFHPKGLM